MSTAEFTRGVVAALLLWIEKEATLQATGTITVVVFSRRLLYVGSEGRQKRRSLLFIERHKRVWHPKPKGRFKNSIAFDLT